MLNGSGANVLGLGLLLGRHESVICAESAHINTDECGSRRAHPRDQAADRARAGREDHARTDRHPAAGRGDEHFAQPGVVAVTQSTEFGTCYSLDGTAGDQGILRGQRAARLPGRRTPRQRGGAPRLHARGHRGVRGRAQLRRHQERRDGRRGGHRDAAPATRSTHRTYASSTCSSRPRCASSAHSSARCSPTTSGGGTPATPTQWPPGWRPASRRFPASTWCIPSRRTPCSRVSTPLTSRHCSATGSSTCGMSPPRSSAG